MVIKGFGFLVINRGIRVLFNPGCDGRGYLVKRFVYLLGCDDNPGNSGRDSQDTPDNPADRPHGY